MVAACTIYDADYLCTLVVLPFAQMGSKYNNNVQVSQPMLGTYQVCPNLVLTANIH